MQTLMIIGLNWKTRIDFSNITIAKQWLAQGSNDKIMVEMNKKFGDIVQADYKVSEILQRMNIILGVRQTGKLEMIKYRKWHSPSCIQLIIIKKYFSTFHWEARQGHQKKAEKQEHHIAIFLAIIINNGEIWSF